MTSETGGEYTLHQIGSHWRIEFAAMASPCEILVRARTRSEAEELASLSFVETRRIEQLLSRYRDDNVIHAINRSGGAPVAVDEEVAHLLDYAAQCYRLSDGLFDITSGVLRRAWTFNGSVVRPDAARIESLRRKVGWNRVAWDGKQIRLEPGMEIDLGGLGKEYAVDRVAERLFSESGVALMANFGGDIRAVAPAGDSTPWVVGIESPEGERLAVGQIELADGGIATSGDARRYCVVDGARLGHILDPRTGWPVADAPRSVTVLAEYCTEAGFLATLAMLHGGEAEAFLARQAVRGHCIR